VEITGSKASGLPLAPDIDTKKQGHRGQVYDLAATVFHLLHKPIPDDWDGRPLPVV
jgi:hypothetical protein